MSDVLLYQTENDGEINIRNGVIELSGGLGTAVYLSLFGGNEDDDGRDKNKLSWWGNLLESEEIYKYKSETQYLLRSLPQTSNNLLRIEDAVKRDLNWMLEKKIASKISLSASVPILNMVKLIVNIDNETFEFIENWRAE